VRLPGTVTDISLGGCYVEMLAPLPCDTEIELLLNTGDGTLRVSGSVRSSQMGMGMRVAFTGMSPVDFERLRDFAPPVTSPQQTVKTPPRPSAPPRPGPMPPQPISQLAAAPKAPGKQLAHNRRSARSRRASAVPQRASHSRRTRRSAREDEDSQKVIILPASRNAGYPAGHERAWFR